MSNSRYQYMHVRVYGNPSRNTFRFGNVPSELLAKGGYTVAYRFPSEDTIQLGFAVCSFADNFDRKRGVQIATGRAESNRHQGVESLGQYTPESFGDLAEPLIGLAAPVIQEGKDGELYLANGTESYLESILAIRGSFAWVNAIKNNPEEAFDLATRGIAHNLDITRRGPFRLEQIQVARLEIPFHMGIKA